MVLLTALLQGAMMVPRTRRLDTLEFEYNYQILEAIINKNNISVPPFSGSEFGLKGGQNFLFFSATDCDSERENGSEPERHCAVVRCISCRFQNLFEIFFHLVAYQQCHKPTQY